MSRLQTLCSPAPTEGSFRKVLLKVGEMRSLAHEAVNVKALTATATVWRVMNWLEVTVSEIGSHLNENINTQRKLL